MLLSYGCLVFPALLSADDDLFDVVSMKLNDMIAPSDDYWYRPYSGGPGIIVRTPDGMGNDPTKRVVPATFWSNDIYAPSQLYPSGDPQCPADASQLGHDCYVYDRTGDNGPWNNAQIAMVVGDPNVLGNLFQDFDNIQADDWGWGVFYATDSNSVDIRCHWLDDYGGYDCPGGWVPWGGQWSDDDSKFGSGIYDWGNPDAGLPGGGSGCHYWPDGHDINQIDATGSNGVSLVQDRQCQCNYDFNDDWDHWVSWWIDVGQLHGPMHDLDISACWMNNFRDMIRLQNAIYWRWTDWTDDSMPFAHWNTQAESRRPYWGWNEIPVSQDIIENPANWDCMMIKLPAEIDYLNWMGSPYLYQLEDDLSNWVYNIGLILVGEENVNNRPGSYMVVVRETTDDYVNYQRLFFCEDWYSPGGVYHLSFDPDYSTCFLDWGSFMTYEKGAALWEARQATLNSSKVNLDSLMLF